MCTAKRRLAQREKKYIYNEYTKRVRGHIPRGGSAHSGDISVYPHHTETAFRLVARQKALYLVP